HPQLPPALQVERCTPGAHRRGEREKIALSHATAKLQSLPILKNPEDLLRRCRRFHECVLAFHRSHSPMTKSNEPRMLTASLIMWPGKTAGNTLRFTNDGARIFSRCGVPPPLLWM